MKNRTHSDFYNNEQALRYVIRFAYIAAVDQYLKVEELPSGKGIADMVYLPKRRSMLLALVVELKWNRPFQGAVQQVQTGTIPPYWRIMASKHSLLTMPLLKQNKSMKRRYSIRCQNFGRTKEGAPGEGRKRGE